MSVDIQPYATPERDLPKLKSIRDELESKAISASFRPRALGSETKMSTNASAVFARELDIDLHEGHPQLTVKALTGGFLVGIFCSFLALYYSLKTGIIPSLNIMCGLGGYVLVKALIKVKIFRGLFTPQENAVIQTAAVAVYSVSSTGFGFGSAYLAMNKNSFTAIGGDAFSGNRIEDTLNLTWPTGLIWCFALCLFGFFIAFPVRDYAILKQKLPFPSGTVTAIVIKNLHESAAGAAASFSTMSKYFSISFVVSLFLWCFSNLSSFPLFGLAASRYAWTIDWDLGVFAIGSILSHQINASMLLGAVIQQALLRPLLDTYRDGPLDEGNWFDSKSLPKNAIYMGSYMYGLFGGLAIMVVQGIFTIGELVYLLIRDHLAEKKKKAQLASSQANLGSSEEEEEYTPQEKILNEIFLKSKVPVWFPYVGYFVTGAVAIIIFQFVFDVHFYQTLISLFILPIFALSNIQGMGKTDWDVSSAYGKLIMFPFGVWNAGSSIIPSLALCAFTICGCGNSASLLQDFKTGHLLGASPNAMFIAQCAGALFGCFVTPTIFLLLTSAYELPATSDKAATISGMYGPIYRMLAVIATGEGFKALPKNVLWIALGFVVFAVVLNVLEKLLPRKVAQYLPDPSGVSIGVLVPASVSLEFLLGGLLAAWWRYRTPIGAEKGLPYVVSGCVAGSGMAVVLQSLLGVFDVNPGMEVQYFLTNAVYSAGQIVVIVIAGIILLSVLICGAWYWHANDRLEEERQTLIGVELANQRGDDIEGV